MLLSSLPSTLSTLALVLLTSPRIDAKPYPKDNLDTRDANDVASLQNSTLSKRCDNPCGWVPICCAADQTCYTDANDQAQCADPGTLASITQAAAGSAATDSGGFWVLSTTTWVETDAVTKTAVFSSFVSGSATAQATGGAQNPSCDFAANQSPCGSICCASGQYCFTLGQCMDAGNGGVTSLANTNTAGAPTRPTTISNSIVTATISPTTTLPFGTPVPTGTGINVAGAGSNNHHHLSGGAIAGIVIGVLVGLALLGLLCFCCLVRGIWRLFFGRKKEHRRRVEETYVVEEHHHHGSAAGASGRRWYGDRPARPEKKKKSGLGPLAAGLGALGIGLAGKKILDKRKRRDEKSDISSSYYSYDYTSESSPSSVTQDRRTRRSSRRGH